MKPVPKYHVYSLFITRESGDVMIFESHRKMNVLISGGVTLAFWIIYFMWIRNLPADEPNRELLYYGVLGFSVLASFILIHFLTYSETLTIRRPMDSIAYEYRSLGGVKGWKRKISDFESIKAYTTMQTDSGGVYDSNDSHWTFELVASDGMKVRLYPSIIHLKAKNREKARQFAQKVAFFMNIKADIAE
ncbi:MAG: hypothetical protein KDI90_12125 [Alphaproteobacteria bacterium]|nr:hypothetical protein [Alphaproteobacteria bacterium]MCB9975606.1 hypothetical protein [Rhodospirillales bacterium]